jgi:hypothetical protein
MPVPFYRYLIIASDHLGYWVASVMDFDGKGPTLPGDDGSRGAGVLKHAR